MHPGLMLKSYITLFFLTFFFYLDSMPAQALEEGDCFNTSTVVITGSITDSSGISEIIVTVDGSTPSAFDIVSGNWTATFTGLSDGPHTLLVTGTDTCGSGNTATTDPLGFEVDTEAVVTITSPVDGVTVYAGDVTVTGTADTDIPTVTVLSNQGHNESSSVVGGNWSVVLTGVTVSSIFIGASGTDNCGNIGADLVTVPVGSATFICSISSIGPTTGCPGDAVAISGISFGAVEGTVEFDGVPATVTLWSDTTIIVEATGGDYSNVTVAPTVAESCSLGGTYSYDDVPPPPPIISYPVEGSQPSSPVTSNIDCDDPADTCEERYDGGPWQPCETPTDLALGAHTIEALCIDTCGNVGPIAGPVNFGPPPPCPCGFLPGAPVLIQSLPREDSVSHLPPDSVTLNMPTNAYLKFVYNESLNIAGASPNIGSLTLETTNCGDDTLVWSAALDYEADYSLSITGVVDCDEGNPAPINLTLRTARDVVYAAADADRRAQSGEGFLDGSLVVRVIADLDGTEIPNAVVQINNTVTVDDPGWVNEVDYTDGTGQVSFASAVVPLNQPITITAMAPGYQYLTFYELDAREVILGLRPSGYKYSQRQQTNIIGDFDPAQYDTAVHPMIERAGIAGDYRPTRLGFASLGLHKRSINAVDIKDVLSEPILIGDYYPILFTANILVPDYPPNESAPNERFDIPTAAPSFEVTSFFRLNTTRTGDMYVSVVVGSCNNESVLGVPMAAFKDYWAMLFTEFLLTMSSFDVQRITVPQGPGTCMTVVLDTTDRGVTSDPLNGCTIIADPAVVGARRTNIGKYPYGWSGQGQTDESTWYEPGFSFARAVRINMSNWSYDPDFDENYSARIRTNDLGGDPMPAVIPTLQGGLIEMDDTTWLPFHFTMINLIDPANNVASKLAGYPDLVAIESDLSLPSGSLTLVIVTTAFDQEIRFVGSISRGDALTVESPTVLLAEVSEWIPWARGYRPTDPGFDGDHQPIGPTTAENSLVDRLFEAWELTANGPSTLSVIGDGADYDPVGHPGVDVDPEFNGDLLMMRLMDSVSTTSDCLEPSYRWIIGYGDPPNPDTPVYGPISNPVWRFYAPPRLIQGGTVRMHLPRVPTVAEINDLGLTGANYTFESPTQTGVPDGFELEWAINAINLPTHTNINNLVERDVMMYEVSDMSQNHQRFIFQKE